MTQALTHYEDRIAALVADWQGQDEMFFHDRAMRTIVWYVGKVKSFIEFSAEIRKTERKKFMDSACKSYGIEPRRMYEAAVVYKKYAKPGQDSVMEISERIFQQHGGWSKALPAKQGAQVETACQHKCSIHQ